MILDQMLLPNGKLGPFKAMQITNCCSCGRWPYAPVAPDGYVGPTQWLHGPANFGGSDPEVECQGDTSRLGWERNLDLYHWIGLREHLQKTPGIWGKTLISSSLISYEKKELYLPQIFALSQCFLPQGTGYRDQGIESWPIIPYP